MGEATDQIKDQIDYQREQLGENLHQLEEKVRDTIDWRTQFNERPMLGLGVAFAGGFLLSALLPGGGSDSRSSNQRGYRYENYSYDPANYRVRDESTSWQGGGAYTGQTQFASSQTSDRPKRRTPEMNEISETVENIRGAVLGLAATRLRSFLSEAVPGFQEEYEQARKKRGYSESVKMDEPEDTAERAGQSRDRESWQTHGSGTVSSAIRHADTDGGMDPQRMPTEPRMTGEQPYRP